MTESLVRRHGTWLSSGAIVLGLGAAVVAPSARFDSNPINLKDPSTESVATFLDLASDPDTSPYTADVVAANLDAAAALSERLEALPGWAHPYDIMPGYPFGTQGYRNKMV